MMLKIEKITIILLLLTTAAFIDGCARTKTGSKSAYKKTTEAPVAVQQTKTGGSSQSKWITDISFGNDAESFNIYIRGNRLLPYTTVKQISPAAVFLYFTDTALDTAKTDIIVNNDIVESIRASDASEKGREVVKVEILLKKNFPTTLPYIITRDGPGVKLSFKRVSGASAAPDDGDQAALNKNNRAVAETDKTPSPDDSGVTGGTTDSRAPARTDLSASETTALPVSSSSAPATRLDSVYAAKFEDGLKVFVVANGMITRYKSSTETNPPRIIFDIADLKSPYTHEKVIPVNTNWVKMVRYNSFPDQRVSVILETRPEYLNMYSATPVENGLMIHLGQGAFPNRTQVAGMSGQSESSRNPISFKTSTPQQSENGEADYTKPAYINQIDFLSEGDGKTALVVEASRPIKYEVSKVGDKKLEFKLFNAQIPDDLQRAVSAKSDDAIVRITPRKSEAANTVISVEMREDAPYTADTDGNRVKLHLALASAPPSSKAAMPEIAKSSVTDEPLTAQANPSTRFQVQPIPVQPEPAPSYAPVQPTQPMATAQLSAPLTLPVAAAKGTASKDLELKSDTKEDAAPRYTGEKIALDFYETDIKNVFRILREVSNMNFAVDKDVSGKVTLTLSEPVPWDQVLDLVLKMNKLGKTVDSNVIRIATAKTLDEEEKVRREQKKTVLESSVVQKQFEPFITEYISVNYSDAEKEILPHVKEILSKDRGGSKEKASASVDKRTNMVIITDIADVVKRSKELIEKLDRVTPQVMIEARIVEATTNFSREIGTAWGSNVGIQNSDKTAGIGPEKGYDTFGGTYGYNMAVNLPTSAASAGTLGFNFMRLAGTPFSLNAALMAMESKGEGRIVSSPKVLTMDNKKATIKQGFKYPYYTRDASGLSNLSFEEVVLQLEVTPHVTPDNRISILMNIDKKDLGDVINTVQSFTVKEAKTELLINDGETVVIGGIVKQTENASNSGIPGLSKIPLLGWLFKSKANKDLKEELLIFITPRIVQLEQRSGQN